MVHLIVVFLVFLLFSISSQAAPKAIISGRVTDSGGAAIKEAHVVFLWDPSGSKVGLTENSGARDEVRAETDESGTYSVDIPPGFYDVFVAAPAFTPVAAKVRVEPGKPMSHNVRLRLDPQVSRELGGMSISSSMKR